MKEKLRIVRSGSSQPVDSERVNLVRLGMWLDVMFYNNGDGCSWVVVVLISYILVYWCSARYEWYHSYLRWFSCKPASKPVCCGLPMCVSVVVCSDKSRLNKLHCGGIQASEAARSDRCRSVGVAYYRPAAGEHDSSVWSHRPHVLPRWGMSLLHHWR